MHRHRERSFHFDTNYVDHGHMDRYVVSSELVLPVNNNDSCLFITSLIPNRPPWLACVCVHVFHAMDLDYKMPSPLPSLHCKHSPQMSLPPNRPSVGWEAHTRLCNPTIPVLIQYLKLVKNQSGKKGAEGVEEEEGDRPLATDVTTP